MSMVARDGAIKAIAKAIARFNEPYKPQLVRLKYQRMSQDMFAFFRGTNHLFAAAWPALKPGDPGPDLLICGDLHLENLGGFRAEDGTFTFDLNDFDEALVGPCSLDLIRCSTSALLAAQVWGLTPIKAIRIVLGYLDAYRATVIEGSEATRSPAPADGPIEELIDGCTLTNQRELLDKYTRVQKDGGRLIRTSAERLPSLTERKAKMVAEAVEEHGRRVGLPGVFRVLDVSARIAGIGSLGVPRYVALIAGDGSPEGYRLLDIKGARPSSLLSCSTARQPADWTSDAVRVVDAQRRLQAKPTAGLAEIRIGGKGFRLRELIPDENRTTIDRFRRKPSQLRRAVEAIGRITAMAQLRGAQPEPGVNRTAELIRWAKSPALEAVLAASVRFAEITREDYRAFKEARMSGS